MQTRTYGDLFKLASALIGTGGQLSDGEQDQLSHFINRRFSEIFNASPSWPRYVVVGEPRTVTPDQTIQTSEDSFYVYGAGTTEANGLYVRNGDSNGVPAYTMYVNKVGIYSLRRTAILGSIYWEIVTGDLTSFALVIYNKASTSSTPPLDGWAVAGSGVSPAPIVRDLSNIGEFVRIHRTRPLLNRSALEYEFYVSALGAHILNQVSTTEGTAWATYKKEFTPFTVTSDYYNSTVEVPGEFFNFISHAVYADFLRVQNKQEEALAEEQAAQTFLALELEKIDIRSNNNTINHKFSTYVNRQAR
tara:strand:+ start:1283 stop:2194 length:912 start_codon:yes stop_codon:yes gene_type:complete